MNESFESCYFVGKSESGDPVIMYDAYLRQMMLQEPKICVNNDPGTQPGGSIFIKTIENTDGPDSADSTEPLHLANGNNMFYVNERNGLRPIINRTPRVFIGTTLSEDLPTGSLFIKTVEEPDSTHATGDLHYEGMYYVFEGQRTVKLVPNA